MTFWRSLKFKKSNFETYTLQRIQARLPLVSASLDLPQQMKFTPAESEQMLDLGERMTALAEVGDLDEAAMWVLQGLEKLNRSTLNSIEERLLQALEDEYLN